ncbi:MAG: helix-turn-helix domain-containing protein [Gammaproteobacteria bacterium]|nr:helix-turn-helix domain-containing protein [Gammaproteobacteria bacterium]
MCDIERFSTRGLAPQEGLRAWGRDAWASIGGLEVHALTPGDVFAGDIRTRVLGPLRLCHVRVERHRAERTSQLVRTDDRGLLQAVFPLRGSSYFRQRDRQAILRPGLWCLCDTSTPYRSITCAPADFLVAIVPRSRLAAAGLDPAHHLLCPRATAGGVDRLLLDALVSAVDRIGTIPSRSAAELGACLVEMMRIVLLEAAHERGATTSRDTLVDRIDAFIRQHLRDPQLSIGMIATALRCTKRYLHKAFSNRSETLSQYIQRLRLERCADDLANPELLGQSITELSYRWGFSDSAYFSRSFKLRFGVPPRTYRDVPNQRVLRPAA